MNPIDISSLTKIYKKTIKKDIAALSELNLSINKGEIFGFLGPNGAGKSTTIKLILNIIKPTTGKISIFGTPSKLSSSRERLGYLPENPYFYDYLTAKELLAFTAKNHNTYRNNGVLNAKIDETLKRLDLFHVKNTRLRKYSKGMVQRAGVAQAIISDPDLLILDEPASGLDPVGRKLVTDIMLELKEKGKTIFFSSHILHDVETICDRVGIIIKGDLKYSGSIKDILSSSSNEFEIIFSNIEEGKVKESLGDGTSFHKEGETFKIVADEKDIWSVTDFIRNLNGTLISVSPKRKNLEDIFFDFISKH